jgi:hypothetical protein
LEERVISDAKVAIVDMKLEVVVIREYVGAATQLASPVERAAGHE